MTLSPIFDIINITYNIQKIIEHQITYGNQNNQQRIRKLTELKTHSL